MLTGIALFLLLLIALLAIPLTLSFQLSWQRALRGSLQLQWGFGLVRLRIPLSAGVEKTPEQREQPMRKARAARRAPHRGGSPFALIRQKALRRKVMQFAGDVWCAVRKRDLNLRVRIGLGDPADTGRLWAFAGPVAGMLANGRAATITLEPEFMDEVFELDGSGTVRLVPLQLLWLTLAMLLSPTIWHGIREMRGAGR